MTREEAIKNIKEHCYFSSLIPQAKEALNMAIKALEQEPCGDAISRKAVLDLAEWFDINPQHFIVANLIDEVENMPSVSPQQRTGQWVKEREGGIYSWRCSNCKSHHRFLYDYCPSCGAKMQEEDQ